MNIQNFTDLSWIVQYCSGLLHYNKVTSTVEQFHKLFITRVKFDDIIK